MGKNPEFEVFTDGGQAVGDDKAGAVLHQVIHGSLGEHLGARIERTGSLSQ